jgi:hypothetical protein
MLFVRLSVNLLRYNSLLNLLDVEQLRDIVEPNRYFMEENFLFCVTSDDIAQHQFLFNITSRYILRRYGGPKVMVYL